MANVDLPFERIESQLSSWNGRWRLGQLLLWVPRGLLAGLLVAVAIAATARLIPLLTNNEVGLAAAICAAVGALGGLLLVLLRPRDLTEQARFADRTFGLKERIFTALELTNGALETDPSLKEQQLTDTLQAIKRVDAKQQLPLTINLQDWLFILMATALLVVAVVLPNPQEGVLAGQRAVTETIEAQIERLEAIEDEILSNPDLSDAQREELLEPIQDALSALEEGGQSQAEALATLSEAEAELRDLEASNSNEQLRQQLTEAGERLANSENASSRSLGESLQEGSLSEAGSAAAQLADELPSLTAEEQQTLADELAETAQALQGTDSELSQELAEAAEALQNGDVEAAQEALNEASGTLQERAQEQAAAQQAASAADELGEGRQEVAQAGQEGEGQAGQQGQQGQQGQEGQAGQEGNQGGEGNGQNGQTGEGSQTGEGTGENSAEGNGQQSGQQAGQPGIGGPSEGGGSAESVFVPEYRDLSEFEGVDVELPAECRISPESCGGLLNETPTEFSDESSLVPYSEVFAEYENAAYEALNEDYVPLGLKGFVRDYFTSLEPGSE